MNILYITGAIFYTREDRDLSFESQIEQLIRSLIFLGYDSVQLKNIVYAALGRRDISYVSQEESTILVTTLEKYVKLGEEYIFSYSK